MTKVETPDISVIIGTQNARHTIAACLHSLLVQCEGVNAEIIVVDASVDGTANLVVTEFPQVRVLRNDAGVLVPHLWKQGLETAQAPIVALTIGQCVPDPGWLYQVLKSHQNSAAAVGGPLTGPSNGNNVDWALYFSRYSNWMPPGKPGPIDDVAGDNASYKREALQHCLEELESGFWETIINARLRAKGETLIWVPEMVVEFSAAEKLNDIVRYRFRHGRHYGSTRTGNTVFTRVLRLLAAPILVPLLFSRIHRRVRQTRSDWMPQLWRALPALLVILSAWSAGEVSGYVWPQQAN
jgi:glycosyltransferase involved in cell wall biosynthesis